VTSAGDWSRPPEDIPGRGETEGFAQRTRKNLDFIVRVHDEHHADVHVVTQVVLSLLGIVVFPFERMAAGQQLDWDMKELEAAGWPRWRCAAGSPRTATLWSLIRNLRHATAHSNIAFSSDSRRLDEVEITFTNNPPHGKWVWEASIRADELLEFCRLFLARIEGVVG
jgi:HEPN pEK499 p136